MKPTKTTDMTTATVIKKVYSSTDKVSNYKNVVRVVKTGYGICCWIYYLDFDISLKN
jgi:hypothetical protein